MHADTRTLTGGSREGWTALPPAAVGRPPRPPRQVAIERVLGRVLTGAERVLLLLILFLFSRALIPLLLRESGEFIDPGAGHPVLRAASIGAHLCVLLLVALRWRSVLAAARRHLPTVALLGLALVSIGWSTAPELTLRRSFALLGTSALGYYLVARFEPRALLRLLGAALGVAAVLSVATALLLPSLGISEGIHAGAWKGIFPSKNNLGQIMVVGTLVFALLGAEPGRRRWLAWAGAATCAALVVLSTSVTALVVLLTCALLGGLLRAVRWHYARTLPLLIGLLLTGATAAVWIAVNREAVLGSIGRDPSLTGRIPLWEMLLVSAAERPLLGHGYSGFWRGWEGPSGVVWEALGWRTPHAHNGFLDLGLDLGVVGVALFLAGFATAFVHALRVVRRTTSPLAYWPPMFLAFMFLYNLSESIILRQNSIFWVLYVAAVSGAGWSVHRASAPVETGPAPRPPREQVLSG